MKSAIHAWASAAAVAVLAVAIGGGGVSAAGASEPEFGSSYTDPTHKGPKLDAQLRLRGAAGHNLAPIASGVVAKTAGWFQRSRLGVQFDHSSLLAYVQLQSSSAFGVAQPGADPVALGLQQGWLRARLPQLDQAWIDAGRLALEYGSGRQIGRYEFDQIGHAFDGVRSHFAYEKRLALDGLAVKLRRAAGQPDHERNLAGLYLTGRPSDAFAADLYFLYLSDGAEAENARLLTMGARLDLTPTPWLAADLEAAVQIGDVTVATAHDPQDHLAWMAAGQLAVSGKLWVDTGLAVVAQVFSGDDDPKDRTRRAWKALYPSRDRLLGLLAALEPSNLQQVGGNVFATAPSWGGTFRGELDVRLNRALAAGPLPAFGGGALEGSDGWHSLGAQADLRLRWTAQSGPELMAAMAVFWPSDALRRDRNTQTATLALLQWTAGF